MPTENFGNFIAGSVSPSSYENFRNFNTARFPKPIKTSEILVAEKIAPGTKISEVLVPRDRHARGFQKETRQSTRFQGPGARTKNGGDQHDTVLIRAYTIYFFIFPY